MPNCLNIKWYDSGYKNSNVLQIYKKGLEFAFLSNAYEQCHTFILCKDFLHDIIHANINNIPINIFNFSYNPYYDPKICLKELRLLVKNDSDNQFSEKLKNAIIFLNEIESKLEMKRTVLRSCENKTWLLKSSKRWMKAPPMISLYVLMLRIGLVHTPNKTAKETINDILKQKVKTYQKKDSYLLKHSYLGFEKILKIGDSKIFFKDIKKNYSPTLSLDCIHNSTGILAFSHEIAHRNEGYTVIIPKWHSV